ncbi:MULTISPECIES: hypothetical protein [unclassified Mesorhizobium]|uniref:hypothetical protein n=1 Tax=unclassified Mesorhizobium TaxID=325217 RepID=UPI000FDB3123|nr:MULTISPECIES: hypothetical protein [unclassified Mesorhizobium]TGQ12472.1 hypothetical protein EN862_016495 [Mesorhizobium sp. M2E.F.Ca.ET.219.01.1.1]TGT68295.1 hypothetical protein EN809_027770 [Mesorhizobium sp. M2E.F.Ca.ET.166.01.1.1]TGW01298.1 hypothetical protein EN797_013080 [Mesorhizobium sp. M2E.F.Ca.ET.154.01.1.1]
MAAFEAAQKALGAEVTLRGGAGKWVRVVELTDKPPTRLRPASSSFGLSAVRVDSARNNAKPLPTLPTRAFSRPSQRNIQVPAKFTLRKVVGPGSDLFDG